MPVQFLRPLCIRECDSRIEVAGQLGERRIVVAVIEIVGITNRVFVGDAVVECAD